MSRRWPGWRTLPGIEIAPLAEKARMQGEPVKQSSYVWDAPAQNYVTSCWWQVDPDGAVSVLGEGWEPIVEDGILKGFWGLKSGTVEELIQISTLVVPEGEPPWSPSLTVRLPPEQIGMYRQGDSMADGIDVDPAAMAASLCVGFTGADGSWTNVVWGITSESAASVIALIRARHGEPTAELVADHDHAEAFRVAAAKAIDVNTVYSCVHHEEET